MTREDILEHIFRNYSQTLDELKEFTDWELDLISDYPPSNIEELRDCVTGEVQREITRDILRHFIGNWGSFYNNYEDKVIDTSVSFISYNYGLRAYEISKNTIIGIARELVDSTNYNVQESVDFNEILASLNLHYPIKFIAS